MIWVTAIVAYLIAYFTIGWRLAIRDLPRAWAAAREDWTMDKHIRSHVRDDVIYMTLFWPFIVPGRAFARTVDATAERGDPKALRKQLESRERRIAELERELGIGGDE